MQSANSSLSLDMPNIDEKHANEIQIVLVIADGPATGKKGTSSVTYEIDTRPDTALEPFQKAERANKGMTRQGDDHAHAEGRQRDAELQRRDRERREARGQRDLQEDGVGDRPRFLAKGVSPPALKIFDE